MPDVNGLVPTEKQWARFWSRVDRSPERDGCWVWTGGTYGAGYGQVTMNYVAYACHRLVHARLVGPIPDGLEVRHTCDAPPCVNPAHLVLGTHSDNMLDQRRRQRRIPGRNQGSVRERSGVRGRAWEVRVTAGYDPVTGRMRSLSRTVYSEADAERTRVELVARSLELAVADRYSWSATA